MGPAQREKIRTAAELLRRTLVMSQSATRDLRLLNELHPENENFQVNLAAMETAFHCLVAAALINDTDWEPLETQGPDGERIASPPGEDFQADPAPRSQPP